MEPIRKPRILVDARHGIRMDRIYRGAVRRGTTFPSSLVHYKGDGEA
jgi:hypothetical protein